MHTSSMVNTYCLTPAEDTQAINHGGVGVCAHQAVGVEVPLMVKHYSGQVLQVNLVNDP